MNEALDETNLRDNLMEILYIHKESPLEVC